MATQLQSDLFDYKICRRCGENKHRSDYYANKARRGGISTYCKPCHTKDNIERQTANPEAARVRQKRYRENNPQLYKEAKKRWAENHPEKAKEVRRKNHLKSKYGLTPEQVDALGTSCGICGSEQDLVIDHCHVTQDVRGRLCGSCNKGLGFFKDSQALLAAAMAYLGREG